MQQQQRQPVQESEVPHFPINTKKTAQAYHSGAQSAKMCGLPTKIGPVYA
jgi:hypothetical protein